MFDLFVILFVSIEVYLEKVIKMGVIIKLIINKKYFF